MLAPGSVSFDRVQEMDVDEVVELAEELRVVWLAYYRGKLPKDVRDVQARKESEFWDAVGRSVTRRKRMRDVARKWI